MEFRNILVGLDLGPTRRTLTAGSALVARQVAPLASLEGARVTVLHSTAGDEYAVPGDEDFVYSAAGLPAEGRAALESACRDLEDAGIETRLVIREERPDVAILRHVVENGVDLVLTGKRSDLVTDGRRIGSVSMHLLRHCPCAVWVARPGSDRRLRSVLAATDLSEVGDRALRAAAHVAARFEAALHVLHAVQLPMSVQMEGADAEDEFVAGRRTEVEARVRTLLSGEMPPALEVHVGLAAPSAAVLHAVDRLEADLLVMGTVSRGGLPGLVVGNTAERLLERVECSLLVVKPADFVAPYSAGEGPR